MRVDRQQRLAEPGRARGLPRRADQTPAPRSGMTAAGPVGRMSPAAALSLQRTLGNAAVARLVERERPPHGAGCDHGAGTQRVADDQAVQRDAMARVDAVTRTSGRPMRGDVRHRMESDFGGEDFSGVRVHIDRGSAEAVGAKAYTTKTDHIVFRSAADMDDHTMRHELQHVRQQRAGRVPSGVSDPADALELDAESTATRLGQGAARGRRSTAGEQSHGPVPAPARNGAVQRMVLKTSRGFFGKWAGTGPALSPDQKNWVWGKLTEHAGGAAKVKKLPEAEALELLAREGIDRAAMEAELGPSASAAPPAQQESTEQYEKQAEDAVVSADRIWREQIREMPRLEKATFAIEGLGRGTVGMLRSPTGPKHPGMLSWFSHGYEDKHRISIDTRRKYGFAVQEEQSLNRIGAPAEAFASLPDAFANSAIEPTNDAPGMYVQPHHATELTLEIDRVVGLVNDCDVAVLMDFQWADDSVLAAEYAEARKAETPPLPVIIEKAQAFSGYSALLIYACRTPWSVNAAVAGSSQLKASLQRELMEQGLSAEEANKRAQEKYEASPRTSEVYQ
ncbi:MAG TPA: DUF4157 domain-containing protein [Streptomyces sp.]|uniref:eCIS core domain-containing protein n=1 Tax=Streptomyces sp. TaxID=1931 RepID=UPI002BB3C025|nr:DUF4157 domain-containing protein [Streptomyces sp.]HWU05776.1 DUF4157 domain-containing protein [Streptomyces sp.]